METAWGLRGGCAQRRGDGGRVAWGRAPGGVGAAYDDVQQRGGGVQRHEALGRRGGGIGAAWGRRGDGVGAA